MDERQEDSIKWSTLRGYFTITDDGYEIYSGSYRVTPKANKEQTLKTRNRILKEDVVVLEVPYYETSNDSNGTTVYIAREV